jgi:hypothetical protein
VTIVLDSVTAHLAGTQHCLVPAFSHFVKLFFILPSRITLYDYQAMCRANKESSDSAHGLLDVSTMPSAGKQLHIGRFPCENISRFQFIKFICFQNHDYLKVFPGFTY